MKRVLLAAMLAAAMTGPHIATAAERANVSPESIMYVKSAGWDALLRTPEMKRVPWLGILSETAVTRRDLMAGPKVDMLEPFLLQPASPAARFMSSWRPDPQSMIW
jgi:hypothetical protein